MRLKKIQERRLLCGCRRCHLDFGSETVAERRATYAPRHRLPGLGIPSARYAGASGDWRTSLEPASIAPAPFSLVRPDVLQVRLRWCASPHSSKQLDGEGVVQASTLPIR